MEKQKKNLFKKTINNPWFITLISTMLGIMLGLYLTNLNEKRLLHKGKDNALEKVFLEIDENHEVLIGYNDTLKHKYESISFILSIVNEDFKLIIPKDSLDSFISKSKFGFTYTDHKPLPNDEIEIAGELEFYISSKLIVSELSHIIWDSYKQMEYLSVTDFDCLTQVESIYQIQEDVNIINAEWREVFFKREFLENAETRNKFLNTWHSLLLKQKLLIGAYENRKTMLENYQ